MNKCIFALLLILSLGLFTACKEDDVYEQRKQEIDQAIQQELTRFGMAEPENYKIINKSAVGEAFAPSALNYLYEYRGKDHISYQNSIRIGYDKAHTAAVVAQRSAEPYVHAYFASKFPTNEVDKVVKKYFDEKDIHVVSSAEYFDFTDVTERFSELTVSEVERLVDDYVKMRQSTPPGYSIQLKNVNAQKFRDVLKK